MKGAYFLRTPCIHRTYACKCFPLPLAVPPSMAYCFHISHLNERWERERGQAFFKKQHQAYIFKHNSITLTTHSECSTLGHNSCRVNSQTLLIMIPQNSNSYSIRIFLNIPVKVILSKLLGTQAIGIFFWN